MWTVNPLHRPLPAEPTPPSHLPRDCPARASRTPQDASVVSRRAKRPLTCCRWCCYHLRVRCLLWGPAPWCPSRGHPEPNGPLVPCQPQWPQAPLSIQQAWLCPELCPFAIFSTPRPRRALGTDCHLPFYRGGNRNTEVQGLGSQHPGQSQVQV